MKRNFKVNFPLFEINNGKKIKYKAGRVLALEVNEETSCPIDKFWARRFKDAMRDNCIELVGDVKKQAPKKTKYQEVKNVHTN